MFAYIITYGDAKTNFKLFDSAKVIVGQRVIQCTHRDSC